MLGQTFSHGIIKKLIVSFGQLVSDIQIEQRDKNDNVAQVLRIPVAYGPREKWYRQITENFDKQKNVKITVPRLAFELNGYQYDPDRMVMHNYSHSQDNQKVYSPVPYNIGINLYLYTRTQEDTLNVVEQILPYFRPSISVTINTIADPLIRETIPIALNSVESNDNWDENFDTRIIVTTFSFTAKINLYGPIIKPKIIKRVIADVSGNKPVPNNNFSNAQYQAEVEPFTVDSEADPHTILEGWS